VVGVENWLGNFYPSGKILLFFLIRIGWILKEFIQNS
jgi:hypothetical protein